MYASTAVDGANKNSKTQKGYRMCAGAKRAFQALKTAVASCSACVIRIIRKCSSGLRVWRLTGGVRGGLSVLLRRSRLKQLPATPVVIRMYASTAFDGAFRDWNGRALCVCIRARAGVCQRAFGAGRQLSSGTCKCNKKGERGAGGVSRALSAT